MFIKLFTFFFKFKIIRFFDFLVIQNYYKKNPFFVFFNRFRGIIDTLLSVFTRLELAFSGFNLFLGNYPYDNVVVTAYALIMIFFFVMPALPVGVNGVFAFFQRLQCCFLFTAFIATFCYVFLHE